MDTKEATLVYSSRSFPLEVDGSAILVRAKRFARVHEATADVLSFAPR